MSKETKRVTNPAYDALGTDNDVYVDPRFTRKGPATRAAEHTLQNMKAEPLPKEWEEFGEIPIGFMKQDESPSYEIGYQSANHAIEMVRSWMLTHKWEAVREWSFHDWTIGKRSNLTDTRPTNITEGAD